MKKYILAIDQGTTSTKVILMDDALNSVAEKSVPFEQYFPNPGWVEHDADQIWKTVEEGIQSVIQKIDPRSIAAIGITNQRETVCFWSKKTNASLIKAIVWQDRRTSSRCDELKEQGWEEKIQNKTGLVIDPYFSSSKIEWALKNCSAVHQAAQSSDLAIGTIDSFLISRLTHGAAHVTESSNASRTMLYNIREKEWDAELLKLFQVSSAWLPEVKPSFGNFGVTKNVKGLPDGIPITGVLGDQQSALLGQACVEVGQAKCTFGTGAFLLMNTGNEIKKSKHRLLTTIAWMNAAGETTYALEGSAFMAGATIQWLRDGLQIISKSSEVEALAREVESTDGVVLVPTFAGLGAPYWNADSRGMISGMTRGTTRAHIARAALEGIAFQNVDILQAMEMDLGAELKVLKVDGGACTNNLLMQMQSDFLGRELRRPVHTETTSLGAVFAAGLGAGIWTSFHEIEKAWKLEKTFKPTLSAEDREVRMLGWHKAINRVL